MIILVHRIEFKKIYEINRVHTFPLPPTLFSGVMILRRPQQIVAY